MAKKSFVSSQPVKLKATNSEDIKNTKWTDRELTAIREIAKRQSSHEDASIDFKDLLRLTKAQLASMVRLRTVQPKTAVSVRLDPRVIGKPRQIRANLRGQALSHSGANLPLPHCARLPNQPVDLPMPRCFGRRPLYGASNKVLAGLPQPCRLPRTAILRSRFRDEHK